MLTGRPDDKSPQCSFSVQRHMADILAAFATTVDQMEARIDTLLALGDAPIAELMPAIRRIGEMP